MKELIANGGMESFSGTVPADWIANDSTLISQVTAAGFVHSGNSAVSLSNGAAMSQTIAIRSGCAFELSFFARASGGTEVGITATVTFITLTGSVFGGSVSVRAQDLPSTVYGYYKLITFIAPAETTDIRIDFSTTAATGQILLLDDVSLSA